MSRMSLRFVVTALSLSIVALGGCVNLGEGTKQSTRFYVLNALFSSGVQKEAYEGKECLAIGLGPVNIPEYLNRPQILTRVSPNELKAAEFQRWAEPLKENFSRVLVENLSVLLSTDRIIPYPPKKSTPTDYRVTVDVVRFDGTPGGNASLVARWTILGANGAKVLWVKKSSFSEATGGRGYEELVSAHSRLVGALSGEIADAIKSRP